MAAVFTWCEHNGAGTTATESRAEMNWKDIDDSSTAYSSSPVTAGNNSYDKFQYGLFTGAWNTILNGLWDHTGGVFGTGIDIYGAKTIAAAGDRVIYRTPVKTADISNTVITTAVNGTFPTSARTVYFGTSSPSWAVNASVSFAGGGTVYSSYLYTQCRTTVAAAAGDSALGTFTFQYDEN
jgi:hypothetical protein